MRLGFCSGILHPMPLVDMIEFAGDNGFSSIEVMCWPLSEHEWGGMTHIDAGIIVDQTSDNQAYIDKIKSALNEFDISISALTYYSNPLHPTTDVAKTANWHIERLIQTAKALDVKIINTYVGMNYDKSWSDNYLLFAELWSGIIAKAEDAGISFAIKNSPASFNNGAIRGSNLARSPKTWEKMFEIIPSVNFGLDYDPAYLMCQYIDYINPIYEFGDRIKHVQFRDVTIDKSRLNRCGTQSAIDEYTSHEVVGEGSIDWRNVVSALRDIRYSGVVSIDILVKRDMEFMKRSLKIATRRLASIGFAG